jgi:predicted permease
VPCVAACLGIAIGLTLRFTGIRSYRTEIGYVLLIRFLLLPAVMVPTGLLLGLGGVGEGIPLKVVMIVSVMPVAFNALVPPAVYGFDLDLANSAWIVSTACLIVVVPVLFGLFSFF